MLKKTPKKKKEKRKAITTVSVLGGTENKNPTQLPQKSQSVKHISDVSAPMHSLVSHPLLTVRVLISTLHVVSDGVNMEITDG